jgi:hypothetical protein
VLPNSLLFKLLQDSNNFGAKGASGYFCTPKKKRVAVLLKQ